MATKKQKAELLEQIFQWQTEQGLEEGWTADQLRYQQGIIIDENFTIDDIFANEQGIFQLRSQSGQVEFHTTKTGTAVGYKLELLDGGLYVISKEVG